MHLTKLELQEMLREMGVKFSHTESYENLKKLFQAENHMRWMGKVQKNGQRSGHGLKRIIRKKASPGTSKMVVVSKPSFTNSDIMSDAGGSRRNTKQTNNRERLKRKAAYTKSEFSESRTPPVQKHAEKSDRCKDVFATVLRRAQNCCEFCGQNFSSDRNASDGPKPFHIQPLDLGGEVSVKNIVALCSTCYPRLTADAQPGDLKLLKRKARGKIIRTVHIQRKPRL